MQQNIVYSVENYPFNLQNYLFAWHNPEELVHVPTLQRFVWKWKINNKVKDDKCSVSCD